MAAIGARPGLGRCCPSDDHDGAQVPVERALSAVRTNEWGSRRHISRSMLCAYCAEGLAAGLLRRGYTVTIEPVSS